MLPCAKESPPVTGFGNSTVASRPSQVPCLTCSFVSTRPPFAIIARVIPTMPPSADSSGSLNPAGMST
jgi:hypothetical protein